jgi:hypothetical protein
MTQEQMTIENGPSEMDLAFSLFRQQPVYFTVDGSDVWCIILGIQAEDGSGKSWIIKGYIHKSKNQMKYPPNAEFHGWFSYNQHRQGWMKINYPEKSLINELVMGTRIRRNRVTAPVGQTTIALNELKGCEFKVINIQGPIVSLKVIKDEAEGTAIGKEFSIRDTELLSKYFEIIA